MFGSKKEVKKMKYTPKNGLILLVSVLCGLSVVYYGIYGDNYLMGAISIGVALILERHLEYDIFTKEN